MGQHSIKRSGSFDSQWRPRLGLFSDILRNYQDEWFQNEHPFRLDSTAAILFWVYRYDFTATTSFKPSGTELRELQKRNFEDWCKIVDSPQLECGRMLPHLTGSERTLAVELVTGIIRDATVNWETSSSCPATDDVALNCAEILAQNGFVRVFG